MALIQWATKFASASVFAISLSVDSEKNAYSAGFYTNEPMFVYDAIEPVTKPFGPGTFVGSSPTEPTQAKGFISKHDQNGKFQWISRIESTDHSPDPGFDIEIADVIVDNNGHVYVLGIRDPSFGSTHFYNADGSLATTSSGGPAVTTTDDDGHYTFTDLIPGAYFVEFITPEELLESF